MTSEAIRKACLMSGAKEFETSSGEVRYYFNDAYNRIGSGTVRILRNSGGDILSARIGKRPIGVLNALTLLTIFEQLKVYVVIKGSCPVVAFSGVGSLDPYAVNRITGRQFFERSDILNAIRTDILCEVMDYAYEQQEIIDITSRELSRY